MTHVYHPRSELKPRNLDGISEDQIAQHWALYEGYVKNVNLLNEKITAKTRQGDYGPEFAELKRRVGFEYDGMILHEHYFDALKAGQKPLDDSTSLVKALKKSFGGFEVWRKEFEAMGKMRGIGWVVLYFDERVGALSNNWITLHESGHPAGFSPLLVMDVWEHAYMVDWGAGGKVDYIEAFFKNVDWPKIEHSFRELTRRAPTVQHA